jgi:integrase
MFRVSVKAGQLSRTIVTPERMKESEPRKGFFERHEYLAIRAHLPEHYADVLDFAYFSGWRRREILELTWAEVDISGGVIRLSPERSKNGRGRTLPMSQPIREVMERRERSKREGCAFVFHRTGEALIDWRRAWQTACEAAGLPGKRLHDCRRTAARNLVRAGVPERVVMDLTGHRTRSVFDRYNVTDEEDLKRAAERLVSYVEGLPTDANTITLLRPSEAEEDRRRTGPAPSAVGVAEDAQVSE